MKILIKTKKCLILIVIRLDDSNNLTFGKMKEETARVATEELAGLKTKMY